MSDFSIGLGRGRGARVALAPGHDEPDEAAFVNVDEDAFFALETIIRRHLPPETAFDHYGITRIEAETWKHVVEDLEREVESAGNLTGDPEQFFRLPWLSPHDHLVSKLRLGGGASAVEFVGMLREITSLGRGWISSYPWVFILGV